MRGTPWYAERLPEGAMLRNPCKEEIEMMEERIMQLEAQMRLLLGLPVIMDAHNEKVAADMKAKNDADARLAARQKAIAGKTPAEIVEMDRVDVEKAAPRGTFDARGFVRADD